MASKAFPYQRLTGDAWWARVALGRPGARTAALTPTSGTRSVPGQSGPRREAAARDRRLQPVGPVTGPVPGSWSLPALGQPASNGIWGGPGRGPTGRTCGPPAARPATAGRRGDCRCPQ